MSRSLLLVEDDALLARAVQTMLERQGWQVVVAHDAGEALRHLHTARLQAVISDLQLPGDSGLMVVRAASRHPLGLRVIAVSGMVDATFYLEVARRAGAHAVLVKPLNEEDLLRCLADRPAAGAP